MSYIETKKLGNNYTILRPVLDLTKQYITNLCDKFAIPYFHDKTNLDPKISKRNYLRLKVLPLIYELSNNSDMKGNTFVESMRKVYGELED
jgi:tRNA(Ile)-lysidine synthase TilS/MesJ